MARKKVYGVTSGARYLQKMTQLFASKAGNLEQAIISAQQANDARAKNFGAYNTGWTHIKQRLQIPPAVSGMYRAFFNEFLKQVIHRGVFTLDELIVKWQRMAGRAFDPELARAIAEAYGYRIEKPPATQTK